MDASERLTPFVSRFVLDWLRDSRDQRHRTADGTLVFVDISGFTRLTERLAAKGKIGAEEMSGILDVTFAALLSVAYDYGAWLVKWGGDAVLLFFDGDLHTRRACTAAHEMRKTMRRVGRLQTSVGAVTLRMSIGVHSGAFDFFLVGSLHHELVICGPAASVTVRMETVAEAGDIVVSTATASSLPARSVGAAKGAGLLLARSPGAQTDTRAQQRDVSTIDVDSCLPDTMRRHLLAGGSDGEHRIVAVAFIEYSGIEDLLESDGPAAAADAVEHVIRLCQEASQRHQVTFWETDVGVDGGKVMLLSGAPRSAGNDEDRILAVVREVVDGGEALRLRAGVTAGRVYTGEFGPPFRRTYSAKGDVVNVAARLMSKAGTGEIYTTPAVLARARTAYATELLPPLTLKGKSRPIDVHRVDHVIGASAAAGRAELDFMGRESELAALTSALDNARNGNGEVWEISGEPGIGKSRLLSEFLAGAAGATVLRVECDQYHSTTPYAPFRRMLRRLAGIADNADPIGAGQTLLNVVGQAAPSLLPWTPLLAAVFDAEVPATPEADLLDPAVRKARQEAETLRLLGAVVPGTLLVVVEDMHLMDEASVDLLRHLAIEATSRAWLVVSTTRRAGDEFALAPLPVRRLHLDPLPDAVVESLVKHATDERPLNPHESAMVVTRAGGNPLFVQELLAAVSTGSSVSALPDSIEGLMAVQVDALQPLDRRVLRVAAVLGVRFDRDVFEEMLLAEELSADIGGSELRAFLDVDGDTLRFRNTLARDSAYEGLPYRRRQLLHGLAGDVIERKAGARADDEADLLSLHFLQSRNLPAAWRYARVAGEHAQGVHAQVEAARFFERALEAAKDLGRDYDGQAAIVAEALGDSRYKLGEFSQAAAAYRTSRSLARGDSEHARLHFKSSLVADRTGKLSSALRLLSRAQRLLAADEDNLAARLRAECSAQYGLIRHWQGRDADAVGHLREAVTLAERAGADDAVATALVWLDNCEMTLGTPGAGEHALRALSIWRRLGNRPWEEARVLNQLGIRAYYQGRWDVAVEYYAQSKDACERAGDQFTAAVESGNMAEVLSDQGHLAAAEKLLVDALRVWRAAAAPSFVAFGKSQLGRLAARRGDFVAAHDWLRSARADYVRDGEHAEVAESDARLAECLCLQGEFDAAISAADAAIAGATSGRGGSHQLALLQRVKGLALAQRGEVESSLAALALSLSAARSRGARHEMAWTMHAELAVRRAAALPVDSALVIEQASLFEQLGIAAVAVRPFVPRA
ncbi:MAG: adenylate/guanylate cyclase domain-containing protein [Mycobacteriales bacterium]